MHGVIDHATQSAFSDPGQYVSLFGALPTDPESLSAVARNLIVHYFASGHELPTQTRDDINARWLNVTLSIDQQRHGRPLAEPRAVRDRVQGCCRDHTLFCVGALRSHGIPARSRVGFAGYFIDGWHADHVVVETWGDGRWRRFDSELDAPRDTLAEPMDMAAGKLGGTGFVTAAQVWHGHRKDGFDIETFGINPHLPGFRGVRFVFDEVIHEVAHRFGDELLLWDAWGRMAEPDSPVSDDDARWLDGVAELLLAADGGDLDAEQRLLDRYRSDPGLHPGPIIMQASPFGDPPVSASLSRDGWPQVPRIGSPAAT